MDNSKSEPTLKRTVGPHHFGIMSKRKMKHTHDCVQCNEKDCDMYIVHLMVMWKKFQDLYLACCEKCLNRLEQSTIGDVL